MTENYKMLTEKIIQNRDHNRDHDATHNLKWFNCYNSFSTDTRCCGLCYCCCPAMNIDKDIDRQRCDWCPNDFEDYWYSGYVQTYSGYGNYREEINGVCCWFCFPVKFPLFFPCFLGSIFNTAINKCCATTFCATYCDACDCTAPIKRNYLF